MRFLLMFVGGQEFHKLKPSNCKGFKNANLVISSTKPTGHRPVGFVEPLGEPPIRFSSDHNGVAVMKRTLIFESYLLENLKTQTISLNFAAAPVNLSLLQRMVTVNWLS